MQPEIGSKLPPTVKYEIRIVGGSLLPISHGVSLSFAEVACIYSVVMLRPEGDDGSTNRLSRRLSQSA